MISELSRGWSDALSTFAVGSLAILLPYIIEIDDEARRITLELERVPEALSVLDGSGPAGAFILSLLFLSVSFALGSIAIQVGELIALVRDSSSGRKRIQERLEKVVANPAMLSMYTASYASFRALCGFGGLLVFWSIPLLIKGAAALNLSVIAAGFIGASLGIYVSMFFARYSFNYLDWVLFGSVRE